MNPPPRLPNDRQLLDAARRGDESAWAELAQRHRVGLERAIGSGRGSKRRVAEALSVARVRLLDEEPAASEQAAIRAMRPAFIATVTNGFYGPAWPGVLADDGSPPAIGDLDLLALAFASLPEPWQTALWHRSVEDATDEEIAPLVGRDADEISTLLDEARRGLVDAFFREYRAVGHFAGDAATIVPLLAGYHAGALADTDRHTVEEHLRRQRIAVAEPPAPRPSPSDDGAPLDAPLSALAPPSLRHHDAVDSRRLLDLVASLDTRLAPAIAPGVLDMQSVSQDAAAPPPVATSSRSSSDEDRRRRLLGVGVALLLVAGVVGAAFLVRGSISGDDADAPAGTSQPGDETDPATQPTLRPDPSDPDPDDADDDTTSTTIALRPDALGPLNTVTLRLADGAGPQGFAATPSAGLGVSVSSPAPILAGGTGTIDVFVRNDADTAIAAEMTFELPRGVRFESGAGATCVDPDDRSPTCVVDVPAAGAVSAAVTFRLESSIVGRFEVDGDVDEPFVTPISVIPALVHSSVGRGDVVVIGNTVTRCDQGAARAADIDCASVADGTGEIVNRWDVPIEFVGAAPQFSLFNSSSAELEIPDGAEIIDAHLYWSGDLEERGASVPDDGRNTTIALGLPGGRVRTIEAGRVVLGDVDASQYLGSNDVTELIRNGGAGSYTVGNVQTVEVQGSYGAWALVVVFDHEDEPRRQRIVTRPFEWVAPASDDGETFRFEVDVPIPTSSSTLVGELDLFALEGELGFAPESLIAGGASLGGDNPFDSSIGGDRVPDEVNSLGVDIDTYALDIDASDGTLPVRATSERDGIRVAVLGLTVDLPT